MKNVVFSFSFDTISFTLPNEIVQCCLQQTTTSRVTKKIYIIGQKVEQYTNSHNN